MKLANNSVKMLMCASLAAATISCAEQDVNVAKQGDLTDVSVSATNGAEVSRTTINGTKVLWAAADKLYVYGAEAPFTIAEGDKGQSSAGFDGAIDLSGGARSLYAVYSPQYEPTYVEGTDGMEVAFTQNAAQVQFLILSGGLNTQSAGNQTPMYGKSASEISEDKPWTSVDMKHVMALQDFSFTNLPAEEARHIAKVEFISSEPFVSQVNVNLDTNEVTPLLSLTNSIAVDVRTNKGTDYAALDEVVVRFAMLPQVIAASADWSLRVTLSDASIYAYTFPSASSDFAYQSGTNVITAVDFANFSEYKALPAMADLTYADVENIGDSWEIVATGGADDAVAFANLKSVLKEVMTNQPERRVTLILSSVTNVPSEAFFLGGTNVLTSVEKIVLPNAVKVLGASVFKNLTSLKSIDMPNVTTLSASAEAVGGATQFQGCSSLESINMPLFSDKGIGANCFDGCTSLTSINGKNGAYFENVVKTAAWTFSACSSLENIYLPNVTAVGNAAFRSCTGLKSLEIATNVESFTSGNNAMFNGVTLSNIDLVTGAANGTTVDGNNWTISPLSGAPFTLQGFKSITTK